MLDSKVVLSARHRHRQRAGRRLREKCNGQSRQHALGDTQRIKPADKEHGRQNHEHLHEVGREHGGQIHAQAAQGNAAGHLHGKHGEKAEDADGQNLDDPGHDREKNRLDAGKERNEQILLLAAKRQLGNGDADGSGNQKHRKNIGRKKRRNDVVRNHRFNILKVAVSLDVAQGIGLHLLTGHRYIGRRKDFKKNCRQARCQYCRQQRIKNRVLENFARFGRPANRGKR